MGSRLLDIPRTRKRHLNPFAPSLDRINCGGGYTKDNTRIVCVAVNVAINTFGDDVFFKMLEGYGKVQEKKFRARFLQLLRLRIKRDT